MRVLCAHFAVRIRKSGRKPADLVSDFGIAELIGRCSDLSAPIWPERIRGFAKPGYRVRARSRASRRRVDKQFTPGANGRGDGTAAGRAGRAAMRDADLGVVAVVGAGAARLRRDPRIAADRHLRLRRRRPDRPVQPARGRALGPRAAAGPDPRPVHRRTASSTAGEGEQLPRSKLAEVLRHRQPMRDEEVTVQRAGRLARSSCCSTSIRCSTRRARWSASINCFQDVTERKRIDRGARPQPARSARAGGALERHLRARRDRHRRARRRGPLPARQRGDLLDHRLEPRGAARLAAVRAAPIPTTATSTRSSTAARSPATSASIRSRSASCARTAASSGSRCAHRPCATPTAAFSTACGWCRTSPSARRPRSARSS